MGDSWIPYVLIILIALVIFSCIYVWQHKDLITEMTGIEFPGTNPKKKPGKKPRPNLNRTKKMHGNSYQRNPMEQAEAQKSQIVNRQAKPTPPPPKPSTDNEEDQQIADVILDTKNSPITSMSLNPNGILLMCAGKNRQFFLLAVGALDCQLYPLEQVFELDQNDIPAVCALQKDNQIQIVFARPSRLSLQSSFFTVDDQAKPVITEGNFIVHNAFTKSIQKMVSSIDGKYVLTLVDKSTINIYDEHSKLLWIENVSQNKSRDFAILKDFSRIAVTCGNQINIYRILKTPVKLELDCTVSLNAPPISLTISEKTHQLIAACGNGSITIFKEPASSGVSLQFQCNSVRIVSASPTSDFFAIISKKSRLMIVDMTTGKPYSLLETTHEGEASLLQWSINGNWLFIASSQKPNISTFCLK